ncbi:hypothetical protein BGX30_003948 [Mortierella sp. GBA39]|nr:hypothetical protein BGX30_003948 [Mortierella sp. GBA39]
MVPDPMCPTCYSEFVEKIEADNDPRAFAPPAPAVSEDGRNHQAPINLEDLFQLFQVFYTPQSPPSLISGLLSRLGIEIHYTTDPAALSGGFGGPMSFGGGFLPMAGNPGDYAWGQEGLDDIITRMMELQNRFSLVEGQDGQHASDHTSPPHGGQDNNSGSGNNAPPGENSNSPTGVRPGGGGGFFGFGSVPPESSGTSIPGSFPSNNNNNNNNATSGNGGGGAQTQSGGTQNTDHNLPMEPLD